MISTELLGEVVIGSYPQDDRVPDLIRNEIQWFNSVDWEYQRLNMYELTHKCKEWALENGYELYSSSIGICDIFNNDFENKGAHIAGTEPEAIFKACQWILDNKEK